MTDVTIVTPEGDPDDSTPLEDDEEDEEGWRPAFSALQSTVSEVLVEMRNQNSLHRESLETLSKQNQQLLTTNQGLTAQLQQTATQVMDAAALLTLPAQVTAAEAAAQSISAESIESPPAIEPEVVAEVKENLPPPPPERRRRRAI
jgi:chromosome segregation ATPase